jgi:hypothetical protein
MGGFLLSIRNRTHKPQLSNSEQRTPDCGAYDNSHGNIPSEDFIGTYRDELIRRCQAKVALRVPPDKVESYNGVPLFLDQLRE